MDLNLEVNPVKVYCDIYDVIDDEQNSITMERALKDVKVAEVINYRLKGLEEITSKNFLMLLFRHWIMFLTVSGGFVKQYISCVGLVVATFYLNMTAKLAESCFCCFNKKWFTDPV